MLETLFLFLRKFIEPNLLLCGYTCIHFTNAHNRTGCIYAKIPALGSFYPQACQSSLLRNQWLLLQKPPNNVAKQRRPTPPPQTSLPDMVTVLPLASKSHQCGALTGEIAMKQALGRPCYLNCAIHGNVSREEGEKDKHAHGEWGVEGAKKKKSRW
jgi:hypothetical protein